MDTLTKTIKLVDDWAEQYDIRDELLDAATQPTEAEADAIHNYIVGALRWDAWLAEVTAEHADWLDEQRTQESARY